MKVTSFKIYTYSNCAVVRYRSALFSKEIITVPTTFLPACFVNLKESTCEARKNVSKSLFVLEIIKFYLFRYSNVMASSNAEA